MHHTLRHRQVCHRVLGAAKHSQTNNTLVLSTGKDRGCRRGARRGGEVEEQGAAGLLNDLLHPVPVTEEESRGLELLCCLEHIS